MIQLQVAKMQSYLEQAFTSFPNGGFFTEDGHCLYLKYQHLTDIGTFSLAAENISQYIQLADGDIAITNDPYSGGSTLSSLSFAMAIEAEQKIIFIYKLLFKPRIRLTDNLEEEGVRIPPMPLYQNKKINSQIIEAISQHPLSPNYFAESITQVVSQLNQLHKEVKTLSAAYNISFDKKFIKDFDSLSRQRMRLLLDQVSSGEQQSEIQLEDKSKIKLRIEISEEKIIFDFLGTENSKLFSLTNNATVGICVGSFLAQFDRPVPINSGVLDLFEVLTPKNSMVNAVYPKPVFVGVTDGTTVIANLILKTLRKIDPQLAMAMSGISQCAFELDFNGRHYFFDTLEPGAAATTQSKGLDGFNLWQRSHLNPSLEEVEQRYPVVIRTYGFRPKSGGDGLYSGGRGVTKSLEVKEKAYFRWSVSTLNDKPEGLSGGKPASNPEVHLQRKGQSREKLKASGELELQPGDTVILHSAGGGGYGEPQDD